MVRRQNSRRDSVTGRRVPAVAAAVLVFCHPASGADANGAEPVRAQAPPVAPAGVSQFQPLVAPGAWDPALAAAFLPETPAVPETRAVAAPAQELASGLSLQVERKRRRFRQRAVGWVAEQSPSVGWMTDFLLGGGDSGWHLVMDPTGDDEYILEFKMKFR